MLPCHTVTFTAPCIHYIILSSTAQQIFVHLSCVLSKLSASDLLMQLHPFNCAQCQRTLDLDSLILICSQSGQVTSVCKLPFKHRT